MATIDIERARRDTPGCERVIHLNNAGAALPPQPVLESVIAHLRREAEIGGYEAADEASQRLEGVYDSLARLINCGKDELALIENATRAWDMGFYALPLGQGDRILTAAAEYASNFIAFLQVARHRGVTVEVVPNDGTGQLAVDALERMIDGRVKLIAVTHIPTNGGLVNPAAAIGRIARRHGIPYLLDACQSVGQLPIDVDAIGCDMLSATGRKFLRGPRGTGFLYVRRALLERLEPPMLDLHAATWSGPRSFTVRPDARRFENWESFVAGRLGLGAAADYALGWGLEAIAGRIRHLADGLRHALSGLPGVTLRDLGAERCGIVSFTVADCDPTALHRSLRLRRINVSVSSAPSTLLDMTERGIARLLRASVHYYNTEAELDAFCAALRSLIQSS